ncbi:class I SAM-dependent methyltransferase [Candidatus Bathyarchaeota archaeon]|nr:class I SAM-dependent methyltransferase [Candidatus Bathyarchaeota archaeon]
MTYWSQKEEQMLRYDSTAYLYNTRYEEEQRLKFDAALQDFQSENGSLILDLGCGTGLLFPRILDRSDEIVGLDISKKMLRRSCPLASSSAKINLVLADADHPPFRTSCFDTVFAMTLLQNMPDPHHTLIGIKNLIKPEGRIIITSLDNINDEQAFLALLHQTGFDLIRFRAIDNLKCHLAVCHRKPIVHAEKKVAESHSGSAF